MQVQFVFRRIAAVEPSAAALDDDGCCAEQVFEGYARFAGMLVAFDAEGQAFEQVLLAGVILIAEHRERRTEDHRLRVLRRPPGVVLGYVDEKSQPSRKVCGTQSEGFGTFAFSIRTMDECRSAYIVASESALIVVTICFTSR